MFLGGDHRGERGNTCVNIYSCSWSVEGGLEKVSQRGEGEILFIEELFSAGEEGG